MFGVGKIYFTYHAHQGCIYVIKSNIINIITI